MLHITCAAGSGYALLPALPSVAFGYCAHWVGLRPPSRAYRGLNTVLLRRTPLILTVSPLRSEAASNPGGPARTALSPGCAPKIKICQTHFVRSLAAFDFGPPGATPPNKNQYAQLAMLADVHIAFCSAPRLRPQSQKLPNSLRSQIGIFCLRVPWGCAPKKTSTRQLRFAPQLACFCFFGSLEALPPNSLLLRFATQ